MSSKRKGITIDVPHVPSAEAGPRDAESLAVAAHPEFQELLAKGRRNRAAGKGLSAREVFADSGNAGAITRPSRNGTGADKLPAVSRRHERPAHE